MTKRKKKDANIFAGDFEDFFVKALGLHNLSARQSRLIEMIEEWRKEDRDILLGEIISRMDRFIESISGMGKGKMAGDVLAEAKKIRNEFLELAEKKEN